MKIELKNLYVDVRREPESVFFDADIYIDGKNIGYVAGLDAIVTVKPHDELGKDVLQVADLYCRTLPPYVGDGPDGKKELIRMNLKTYVKMAVIEEHSLQSKRRFDQEMKRDMEDGILVGVPGEEYSIAKLPAKLSQILADPELARNLFIGIRNGILPTLKKGEMILNDNLPYELCIREGIRPELIAAKKGAKSNKDESPPLRDDQPDRRRRR